MKNKDERGFVKHLTLIVLGVCLVFIVFIVFAQYVGPNANNFSSLGSYSGGDSATGSGTSGTNPLLQFMGGTSDSGSYSSGGDLSNVPAAQRSPYAGEVQLGSGSAEGSIQPGEEYVTLRNSGDASVDITGWTLTNGKGTRPIQTSENNYVYPAADSAKIGQGTQFLDPSGNYSLGDIVLKPSDSAIVTTGSPFSQFPLPINVAFRENICEGYLRYPFQPPVEELCPNPVNDPLIKTVTSECYDYLDSLSSCEDPQKYDEANFDAQTSQCRSFIAARMSYPACVSMNQGTSGFSLGQWRVYLGKQSEMWASENETITVYDRNGLIVDQISY